MEFVKKLRILTLALIFSGALNIALFASILFFVLQDQKSTLSVSLPVAKEKKREAANSDWIAAMEKLSFRELVAFLTDKEMVEEGYTKRDLAVGSLVASHHFNLEKALSAPISQKRMLGQIEMYPGLTDEQFEAIIRYAYQEKWPLTSKGLFCLLQKNREESLEQAFLITPEFYSLQMLFQKTEAPQENKTLLSLISEGNWDLLERFTSEQAQMLDLSVEKRRRLLLSYLALHSTTAAQLLLDTDFEFALKKLDDKGIIDLISLLKGENEAARRFYAMLLKSPRSDGVWQAAKMRLGPQDIAAAAEPAPEVARAPERAVEPPVIIERVHVVKEGENLWKIARQYKIKVDELVQLNGLEKDRLLPGMSLKLPHGTGSEPPR